ncbi:MAG TPA: alpha/beta fold hydrolase [Candidatus Limnocylindria bacterium]|nr:alpha/beta fold hydrolase [Candidatus Limnocylindria bacterium]
MATLMLVHGGWGGGWEWRQVAERLAARGHRVHRPTLTGLGERQHLGRPDTDLQSHIADVIAVCDYEDLDRIVLVGQSYGGAVVTGVADAMPERIVQLVYLDAFVPVDGQSVMDLTPAALAERLRQLARDEGDGWRVPIWFTADDMGYPPEVAEWYVPKLCPHPLATLEQRIRLTGAVDRLARTYVRCGREEQSIFTPFAERARAEGWRYAEIPVGHDAHVIAPDEVVSLLDRIATAD